MNYPYQSFPNNFGGYPQQQPAYMPQSAPMPDNLMQMRAAQQQPRSSGLLWVQGEEGAKAYMVGAGNCVVLWDSESPTIYIKSADMAGIPSMRVLEWKEKTGGIPVQMKDQDYITRAEFDELKTKISELIGKGADNDAEKS